MAAKSREPLSPVFTSWTEVVDEAMSFEMDGRKGVRGVVKHEAAAANFAAALLEMPSCKGGKRVCILYLRKIMETCVKKIIKVLIFSNKRKTLQALQCT